MTTRRNPCNDMESVHIQAADLRALQDYIDAQSGGPGQGLLPHRHQPLPGPPGDQPGKLAVAGGDRGLAPVQLRRVPRHPAVQPGPDRRRPGARCASSGSARSSRSTSSTTPSAGPRWTRGELGLLDQRRQPPRDRAVLEHQDLHRPRARLDPADRPRRPAAAGSRMLNGSVGQTLLPGAIAAGAARSDPPSARPASCPSIRPPPHCNTRGLTALGAYLIDQMIAGAHDRPARPHGRQDRRRRRCRSSRPTTTRASSRPTAGTRREENPRIYNLGGFVTPIAGASPPSFIDQWKASLSHAQQALLQRHRVRLRRRHERPGRGEPADHARARSATRSRPTTAR